MNKFIAVIPVYNFAKQLRKTIETITQTGLKVIVVDDGSHDDASQKIDEICQTNGCYLIQRTANGGKGAAVMDGLQYALDLQCTHVFQVDADGQHDLKELASLLVLSNSHPNALLLGNPVYDQSIPLGRKIGRWFTHIWIWINTLSFSILDSMCGFRIYPLKSIMPIIQDGKCGKRMDFDPEICVRACWSGIPVINFPVRVQYPEDGASSFRLLQDNVLISRMHTRLFFGMLIRLPRFFARKFQSS